MSQTLHNIKNSRRQVGFILTVIRIKKFGPPKYGIFSNRTRFVSIINRTCVIAKNFFVMKS